MYIFNRTLWLLILIPLLLLSTFAQEYIEYNENLPDLRFENSDTYDDGTIVLLFTQKSNKINYTNTKLHLRIVFVNRTILPVEIDYSSYPNFCVSTGCILFPKALIENYVLIKSINQLYFRHMIVSWDGTIHKMYETGNRSELVTTDINSRQKFFVIELYNDITLKWRRYTVQNPNDTSLKEENGSYNIQAFKDIVIKTLDVVSLIEGGYATIMFTESRSNEDARVREIYVVLFKDDNNSTPYKQYLLYSTISRNELNPIGCRNSFDGSGYTLDFTEVGSVQPTPNIRIHFLSNGAVIFIVNHNLAVPLFYGGYTLYNETNAVLTVYDDNNRIKNEVTFNQQLYAMSTRPDTINTYIMQKQSLLWSIDYNNNQIWKINYYPLGSIDFTDSRYIYQNPSISGTYPKINETIQINRKLFDFIINYNRPITLSSGNVIIYQYLNNDDTYLRQIIPGQSELCQLVENNTAISVKIFVSALHQINVKYGVRVENNFAKSQLNEDPLIGISEKIWTFNTSLEIPEKPADRVTITARLKFDNENINFYREIGSKNSLILLQLKDELVQAIPIQRERLEIHKKVQKENTNDGNQVLISATIMPPVTNNGIERNTESILKDLNELIQQKKYNNILRGDITKFLDENYEVQAIPDFWERYKIIFIILAIGIVIVGCVILFARYKNKNGKNFSIVKIIMIISDLILDVAFVTNNANDIPYLFIFSLLSIIIPILFNMAMAIYSLAQEIIYNQEFNKWGKENGFIISIFTVLSSADVEALHILSSKIAGLNAFSAPPLSTKITRFIFWAGCINIFLEDIPQFIIQVYYNQKVIVYTIIPTLTLITSCTTLCINIVGKIYFFFMHFHKNNKRNSIVNLKM